MKRMGRWESLLLVLGLVGLGDSIYLLSNTLFPSLKLWCPNTGIINCGEVTSSPFSHVYGIPVALLAALWFASIVVVGRVEAVDLSLSADAALDRRGGDGRLPDHGGGTLHPRHLYLLHAGARMCPAARDTGRQAHLQRRVTGRSVLGAGGSPF